MASPPWMRPCRSRSPASTARTRPSSAYSLNDGKVFGELMQREREARIASCRDPAWRARAAADLEQSDMEPRWETFEVSESQRFPELNGRRVVETPPSLRLHFPLDVTEEAANRRGCFALYEGPNQTLDEAGHRGVWGDGLREAHPRGALRRPLKNDRAADVGVVALDWETLEADPVDAVALVVRGIGGHHAHRAGGTLSGDEAVGVGPHALAGGKIGHAARRTDDVPEVGVHTLAWRRDGHGLVDIGWELGHGRRIPLAARVVQSPRPPGAGASSSATPHRAESLCVGRDNKRESTRACHGRLVNVGWSVRARTRQHTGVDIHEAPWLSFCLVASL